MIELSILKGGEEVMKVPLQKETTCIGRSSQNDICLPDPAASRTHLVIVRAGDDYIATDKSTNGTFVNDERITSCRLKKDDLIRIGAWTIRFAVSAEAADEGTEVPDRDPTRVLSHNPERGEILFERAILEVLEPSKRILTITRSVTAIGKSGGNDVVLEDDYVSNFHCKIENRKGTFFLKDLQSTNGTTLNGRKIIESPLPFNSTIEIGKARLRFFAAEEVAKLSPSKETEYEGIVSTDLRMREIFMLIGKVAPSDVPVLIEGESGTGKELVARALHRRSGRDAAKFVAINCGGISKDLIESELFGHEKGAFTSAHQQRVGVFEQADGGTLFLDEIGELPIDLQPKLLRALETGEIKRVGGTRLIDVDARIVAATNKDLAQEVNAGRFREDLFYRLFVVPVRLPPLRDRPKDIPLLAERFLAGFAKKPGNAPKRIDPAAMDVLANHAWPGNVRELRNVLSRAFLRCEGEVIGPGDIEFAPVEVRERTAYEFDPTRNLNQTITKTLRDVERERILRELKKNDWNKKETARVLGIAKSTLHEKLRKYGIGEPE
jgi:DNA-binding NtrC family response regulator